MELIFTTVIPIKPQAKQSARFITRGNNSWSYQPKKKVLYVTALKYALAKHKQKPLLTGPLKLDIIFYTNFSKGPGWQITRPDIDNYCKGAVDSMTDIIYEDDSQICWINAIKRHSKVDGISISLYKLSDEDFKEIVE